MPNLHDIDPIDIAEEYNTFEVVSESPVEILNDGPMLGRPKALWIGALNKLDGQKCRGQLYEPESKYSAIGALCLVHIHEVGGHFETDGTFVDIAGNKSRSGAPPAVREWIGMESTCPGIQWGGETATIVAVNDGLEGFRSQLDNFQTERGHILDDL